MLLIYHIYYTCIKETIDARDVKTKLKLWAEISRSKGNSYMNTFRAHKKNS